MIKLYNADCFDIMPNIADKSIDLIFTDIPYNISKENNFKTMKDRKGRNGIDFGQWDNLFDEDKLSVLQEKIKIGGSLVIFSSFEQFNKLRNIFNNLELKDKLIWEKTNPMPRNRDRRYISNVEICSWYVKPKGKWIFNRQSEKYEGSVLRYPSESGGGYKRYHPTQKNLRMVEYLIKIHSNENDLIFDPFTGSGTTGIACHNLSRNFIGIEKSKEYYDIAVKRIQDAGGNVTQQLPSAIKTDR